MLGRSALKVGIVLILLGVGGVGAYAAGVVDIVVNDLPDRSWLFWGFGFLGFGLISLGTGVGLLFLWRSLGRQESRPGDRAD